jgi:hypothetical protein
VIIADTRSSMVAADSAATIGCAFDFDVYFDYVARKRLETGAQAPGNRRASAWKLARKRLTRLSAWEG